MTSAQAKSVTYFEPPSRLQLLDKLNHLVRFSDFLLSISAESGMGKSTLARQLLPLPEDNTLSCCSIELLAPINAEELLSQLIGQLPSHEQGGAGFADQLKVFHLQLKALAGAGQKCLILVDNAEFLSAEALELLLNLHATEGGNAQLLLLSSPEFATKLSRHSLVQHLEGRTHQLQIMPLVEDEVMEYLEVCHPAVQISEKQKQQLWHLSEGIPGKIESLLKGEQVSRSASSKVKAFPLPLLHMSAIGGVLVAILLLSLWKFMPAEDQEASGQSADLADERVTVPLEVKLTPSTEVGVAESIVVDAAVAEQENSAKPVQQDSELDKRLKIQETRLQAENKKVEPQATAIIQPEVTSSEVSSVPEVSARAKTIKEEFKAVIAASSDEVEPKAVQPKEVPPAVAVVPAKPKLSAPVKLSASSQDESVLLGWPATGYTLQMLGARSEKSAKDFIAAQSSPEKFHFFSTVYKGQPWFVVVYGQYPNRDVANSAVRRLPAGLKKVKPWARSIQGVQLDIRKKKSS